MLRQRVFDPEGLEHGAVEEQEHDPEGEVVDRSDPEENPIPPLTVGGHVDLLFASMVAERRGAG